MGFAIFDGIRKVFDNVLGFCTKALDASDPEKYVQSVEKLSHNVDQTYEKMREIISADETISADEKIEKLEKIANSQLAARKTCEEAIKGNREDVVSVASEVLLALATCGISYAPKLISKRKKKCLANIEAAALESQKQTELISEKGEA